MGEEREQGGSGSGREDEAGCEWVGGSLMAVVGCIQTIEFLWHHTYMHNTLHCSYTVHTYTFVAICTYFCVIHCVAVTG